MGYFRYKTDRGRWRAEKIAMHRYALPSALSEWLRASPEPPPVTAGLVRLAVETIDDYSGRPQGIFHATRSLENKPELSHVDHVKLRRAIRWFGHNLRAPRHVRAQAIFWFKLEAAECRHNAWRIVRLLQRYGHVVHMMTSTRPGRIVYKDEHQVAAVPFRDRDLTSMLSSSIVAECAAGRRFDAARADVSVAPL